MDKKTRKRLRTITQRRNRVRKPSSAENLMAGFWYQDDVTYLLETIEKMENEHYKTINHFNKIISKHLNPPKTESPRKGVMMVDPAYPKTDFEKAVCAVMLAFVEARHGVGYNKYLDATVLTTHPDYFARLASVKQAHMVARASTRATKTLAAFSAGAVGWLEAREYLVKAGAIILDRSEREPRYWLGPRHVEIRAFLPEVIDDYARAMMEVADAVQRCRAAATK